MAQLKDWISRSAHSESFKDLSAGESVLVGVTGIRRTEWILDWLVKNPKASVVWVEKSLSVLPTSIAQKGGGLERILFIETAEIEWTLVTLLRSQLFQAIVSPAEKILNSKDEKNLRRLQLLAEKARCKVFLLADSRQSHWAISEQIET